MGCEGGEVDFIFLGQRLESWCGWVLLLVFLACTGGGAWFYEFTGGLFLCDYDGYDALDGTSGAIYGPKKDTGVNWVTV